MAQAMNPARLEAFALAYLPAMLEAVRHVGPWTGAMTAEAYAVEVVVRNMELIRRAGVEAAMSYYLNNQGGALRLTCEQLGILYSANSIAIYLGGA